MNGFGKSMHAIFIGPVTKIYGDILSSTFYSNAYPSLHEIHTAQIQHVIY